MPAPRRMFDAPPSEWKALQVQTAQMFTEIGCTTSESYVAALVRGHKEIDVFVDDNVVVPRQTYAVECKLWKKAVEQETIHAFRTVCADLGVTIGFVVAQKGFQSGAREAAERTNVRLVTFEELQDLFFDRWYDAMIRRLAGPMKALFPFWDPTGGYMPLVPWGAAEREKHRQLLSQFGIVIDADHWVVSRTLSGSKMSLPLPRTFPDYRQPNTEIEVTTYRQYFDLIAEGYPLLLREMQLLHGASR